MKIEVKVPAMGESISEATVGTFIKSTGSFVSADAELLELETDKVNQVLYAPQAGSITWNVNKDDVVKIGQVLGFIDTDAKGTSAEQKAAPEKPKKKVATPAEAAQTVAPPQDEKKKESIPTGNVRLGKEQFLAELEDNKSDQKPVANLAKAPAQAGERRESRKKMSKIRKIIAERLVDVLQQTAMLTTFNEVDMSQIMALRETYKETFVKTHQAKLGFMSFFVKAVVSAMKAFPEINAYIDGDEIVYREYFDIGIAVGTDKGLIVPVVRSCDRLSFAGIEQAIEEFAKKAREGGLSADDLQGGGFTITNGGVYGSLLSTPILNPPQSAILGMHKISKRAVVVNDEIVIRPMMYLALSYDHRVVDGKEAVSFLVHIKNSLEDPSRMLLDL